MRNFFFINLCALFVLLTVQESFAGSLTDLRDGKTYKTVTILGQEWMAKNLNLEYNVGTAKSGCLMVKGNFPGCDFSPPEGSTMARCKASVYPEECDKHGRTYTWAAAVDSAGLYGLDGLGCGSGKLCERAGYVRGICPEGWHLPKSDDFYSLLSELKREIKEKTGPLFTSCVEKKTVKNNVLSVGDGCSMDDIDPDFLLFKCDLLGFEYENLGPDHMAFFWTSTNYYDEKEREFYVTQMFLQTGEFGSLSIWPSKVSVGSSIRCIRDPDQNSPKVFK